MTFTNTPRLKGHRMGDIYIYGAEVYHYDGEKWAHISIDYPGVIRGKKWDLYVAQEQLRKLAEFLD